MSAQRDYFITWSAQSSAQTLPVVATEGFQFILESGQRVDDGLSNIFNASFGYSAEPIKLAIKEALDTLPVAYSKWNLPSRQIQSERLKTLLGLSEGKIFYTVSGAESVENSLKIARQYTGKQKILARKCSYHGATLGALSVSGDWRNDEHKTVDDWTIRIPEPSEDPDCSQTREVIERTGAENIAAFCLETVTGSNGVRIAPKTWWAGIISLAKEYNILLIIDEILNGFYRCGSAFAFQQIPDLKPDFVCMSKGISGGYVPFGAIWVSEMVSDYYQEQVLSCGSTAYAHPLGVAAMSGVLDILENEKVRAKITRNEKKLADRLELMAEEPWCMEVRYQGMLAAIETNLPDLNWFDFIREGVHLLVKDKTLILAPPLTIESEDLIRVLNNLKHVLAKKNA